MTKPDAQGEAQTNPCVVCGFSADPFTCRITVYGPKCVACCEAERWAQTKAAGNIITAHDGTHYAIDPSAAPDAPTPRTDAAMLSGRIPCLHDGEVIVVYAEFSRTLERELAKEHERSEKFKWQVRDTCARAEQAEAALAAANAKLAEEKP